MSVSGLLFRFTGIYLALLACIAVAFDALGLKANSGVNSAALVGAVLWSCAWFARNNGRFLEASERTRAVLGMWGIDVGFQVAVALALGAALGTRLPLMPMLLATGFIGLMHGVLIYFMVGLAGKQDSRQRARGA